MVIPVPIQAIAGRPHSTRSVLRVGTWHSEVQQSADLVELLGRLIDFSGLNGVRSPAQGKRGSGERHEADTLS